MDGEEAQFKGVELKVSDPGPVISDQVWQVAASAWIEDYVRNSPVSEQTSAWNHLMSGLPHLRHYLERELANASSIPKE